MYHFFDTAPQVLSCGVGECVGGDGTDRRQAALVQSLAGFPAVWMACGNSHSVVIGAGGEALAFGLNSHGQVGQICRSFCVLRGRLERFSSVRL